MIALLLVEEEPLVMDELKRLQELMRTIKEVGRPDISMKLVNAMKAKFPELTVERIYTLFQWTVWLSKLGQDPSVSIPFPGTVMALHVSEESCDPSDGVEELTVAASKRDDDSRWDPLLSHSSGQDTLEVYHDPACIDGMLRGPSPMDFVDVKGSVDESVSDVVDEEVNLALETMFPELHQVVEEDFDLL